MSLYNPVMAIMVNRSPIIVNRTHIDMHGAVLNVSEVYWRCIVAKECDLLVLFCALGDLVIG